MLLLLLRPSLIAGDSPSTKLSFARAIDQDQAYFSFDAALQCTFLITRAIRPLINNLRNERLDGMEIALPHAVAGF